MDWLTKSAGSGVHISASPSTRTERLQHLDGLRRCSPSQCCSITAPEHWRPDLAFRQGHPRRARTPTSDNVSYVRFEGRFSVGKAQHGLRHDHPLASCLHALRQEKSHPRLLANSSPYELANPRPMFNSQTECERQFDRCQGVASASPTTSLEFLCESLPI